MPVLFTCEHLPDPYGIGITFSLKSCSHQWTSHFSVSAMFLPWHWRFSNRISSWDHTSFMCLILGSPWLTFIVH
jgi:hypothetical protein